MFNLEENEEYQTFQMMLYQLWLMSFVGDYEYGPLQEANPLMAQVIVCMYFILVSIITINIYIALLSEAFARVNETASEKAYLAQARFILNIEMLYPEYSREFEMYLNTHCAPKVSLNNVMPSNVYTYLYSWRAHLYVYVYV